MIEFPHSLSSDLCYVPAARCYPETLLTANVVEARMFQLEANSDSKFPI